MGGKLFGAVTMLMITYSVYAVPPTPFGQWGVDAQTNVVAGDPAGLSCSSPVTDTGYMQRTCSDGSSTFIQNIMLDAESSSESFVKMKGGGGISSLQKLDNVDGEMSFSAASEMNTGVEFSPDGGHTSGNHEIDLVQTVTDSTGPLISSEIFSFKKGNNDPLADNYDGTYTDLTLVSRIADFDKRFVTESFFKKRKFSDVSINIGTAALNEENVFYQKSTLAPDSTGEPAVTIDWGDVLDKLSCAFSLACVDVHMGWYDEVATDASGNPLYNSQGDPVILEKHGIDIKYTGGVTNMGDIHYSDSSGNEYDDTVFVQDPFAEYQGFLTSNNLTDPVLDAKASYDSYMTTIVDPFQQ